MDYQFFGPNEIRLVIDLGFSLLSGIIIGVERESRHKDAGISTHVMVIVGAMVFTFMSASVDPASRSRIAAQVVTGIGFLGAGLILKEGASVKNLTTAASLWVTASIGMAYGYGYHAIGLMITLAVALTPRIPHFKKHSKADK